VFHSCARRPWYPALGYGKYCSPRHRMPYNSTHEGSKRVSIRGPGRKPGASLHAEASLSLVSMTWRALSTTGGRAKDRYRRIHAEESLSGNTCQTLPHVRPAVVVGEEEHDVRARRRRRCRSGDARRHEGKSDAPGDQVPAEESRHLGRSALVHGYCGGARRRRRLPTQ